MKDNLFDRYCSRVAKKAWLKSVFIGLTVAFTATFVSSVLILTLQAEDLFYVAIIIFTAVAAISIPLLYYLRYRPGKKDVAHAVDELGMEERFVTMVELEGKQSYIARRQREDTYTAAAAVPEKAIRITVSTLLIVLLCVAGALALGATLYAGLVYAEVAPGFGEMADARDSAGEAVYYTVEYEEYGGEEDIGADIDLGDYEIGDGIINGQIVQIVERGANCTTVYAEALDDSIFVMWSDGVTDPERTDLNIQEDKTIYAIFVQVDDDESDSADGSGEGEGDGDSSGMGEESSQYDSGEADDSDEDGEEGEDGDDSENTSSGAGGGNRNNDNVYDNNTDYRTEIEGATEEAGRDAGGGDFSDIVGGYFGRINP